ncbi:hypothetical protein COX95_04450 [bacterium CG_4_10_14_0_2_um_filter_33_32]|nr:MAG: hypothetical protein AUJ93_02460 [bacterium CG2_30_33_46]PIR67620.1 MAG: hypothetical protein COU50_02360 [bacterium CG10_big_fil_rev_8_21_14_0_10_33_18]PIU76964.1 MAG: hypothetical protein COS74_01330 [bacterium CG06_land_8_20_14_3_00_33_50]PIW81095.1 MAG: hypothetical protein COZ97_03535 [bacterium CG_4_8_14_3_um_filter_33_28]PIY85253.1 MAG: hypothetical protein COY76_03115 [bacterium CG_4_10_14_0_8_um_filter_33_57]PIZ85342.1 MAG: hypothetical protein COX95_04450 [bacterium CG_4_10_1
MIPKKSISDISFGNLLQHGIRDIILDLNCTILPLIHEETKEYLGIKPEIIRWIKRAQDTYLFNVYILSNTKDTNKMLRVADICGIDGVQCLCRGNGQRWKPFKFQEAFLEFGIKAPAKNIVMIGNGFLLDWLFPKWFGMKSILVLPNLYRERVDD